MSFAEKRLTVEPKGSTKSFSMEKKESNSESLSTEKEKKLCKLDPRPQTRLLTSHGKTSFGLDLKFKAHIAIRKASGS